MTLTPEISHFPDKSRGESKNRERRHSDFKFKKPLFCSGYEVKITPTEPTEPFIDPYITNTAFGARGYPGYKKKRISLEAYMRKISKLELPGAEHLKRYVHHKYRLNLKPTTIEGTIESGKQFLTFLKDTNNCSLEDLSREELEAFIEHEQDRGLAAVSVYTRFAAVKAFLHYLIREGVVDREVLARSIRIKVPESLPRAIDPEDIHQLLSVITDTLDRAMILVLLRTGMRIGELLNTTPDDINLKERTIHISEECKTSIARIVYFSDDASKALQAWLKIRDERKHFVFYTTRNHNMGYATARVRFYNLLVKAGLADKGYSLHCLRHTFATEMLNAGMRLEVLQKLLGHTSIEVTRRYARLTDKTREEEYFRAMEVIEKGQNNEYYQLDTELQAILEEKKFLRKYNKKLSQRPETISDMGGCAD